MSEIEREIPAEINPIKTIYTGECASLSTRSTLTYEVGEQQPEGALQLRIVDNTGKGMWCKEWASASAIQDIVLGESELTAQAFNALHPGKSINTGGFYLAALKNLGLVRANAENTRLHEHIPTVTFEKAVEERLRQSDAAPAAAAPAKPARRKTKGA